MKKKKIKLILISCVLAIVCGLTCLFTSFTNTSDGKTTQTASRTIEADTNMLDYQSVFDQFEEGQLETTDGLTTFEGYQTLNLNDFSELDLVADSAVNEDLDVKIKYNFSFDAETGTVTISAKTINKDGFIEVDEIQGVAFYDENGKMDALLDIDGESVLLSELQDSGMIANCGWFKRLWKKVVVAVVAVVVVSAVAAAVVATCGAGLGACIAAGAIAGGITGGVAGGVISYSEYGKVDWRWVVGGAAIGAAIGAVTGWTVGSISGASAAPKPKFGDTFGKYGTYVKNPKIKVDWSRTTMHGAQRMTERNMTRQLVEKVVSSGKVFSQAEGSKFLFLSKEGAVVLSKSGELITTYSSANFTEDIIALLKLLGVL